MSNTRPVYKAPKPRVRPIVWIKFIAARVFFPPILLWDGLKLLGNKLGGKFVGKLILAAQTQKFDKEFDATFRDNAVQEINASKQLSATRLSVHTHDGAVLDTLELKPRIPANPSPSNEKYIINLVGNGMCYEHIVNDMENDAIALNSTVIGFNLRGVGHSTSAPRKAADLVTDTIAQVQRLLDQGVDPENITLRGHSLGAAIATLTTKHFHDLGIKINVFNGRSFSSITNFLVGHVRQRVVDEDKGRIETIGGKILGWIAKPLVKFAVSLLKWEIEAGDAYKALPESHKEYIVARSSKAKRKTDQPLDDIVIPYYASIHAALKGERSKQKTRIDKAIKLLDDKNSSAVISTELTQAKESLKAARTNLKERKVWTRPEVNAHNCSLENLYVRSSSNTRSNRKNALTFFREFQQRAHTHHEKVKAAALPAKLARRS
jgi:hypothetical protein